MNGSSEPDQHNQWVLRPLTLLDVPATAAAMARNRDHIGRYMRSPSEVAGDLVTQLCSLIASQDRGESLTVAIDSDGAIAGLFSLIPMAGPPEGHEFIGWVATQNLRRGAGQAALARLCDAAAERGIATVYARIRSDNDPMNALARAEGFVPIEVVTAMGEKNGIVWWLLRRDSAPPK